MAENQKNDLYEAPLSAAGMEDSKTYRRFVAASSADRTDNRAVWSNEMNDAFAALKVRESTGVRDREESLPKALQLPGVLGGGLLMGGIAWLLIYLILCGIGIWGLQENPPAFLLVTPICMIVVGAVLWSVVHMISYILSRRAWIARMREQEQEKVQKEKK